MQDLANPTALLMSSCMMLRHINLDSYADNIQVLLAPQILIFTSLLWYLRRSCS